MSTDIHCKVGRCVGCQKDRVIIHLDHGLWRCHACHAMRLMRQRFEDEMVVYF